MLYAGCNSLATLPARFDPPVIVPIAIHLPDSPWNLRYTVDLLVLDCLEFVRVHFHSSAAIVDQDCSCRVIPSCVLSRALD